MRTFADMDEPHAAKYERVAEQVRIRKMVAAAQKRKVAQSEEFLRVFVSKQISSAGTVADLTAEQRGHIKGFTLGLVVCGPLPSSAADRILASIFGADFFAKNQTTVRIFG